MLSEPLEVATQIAQFPIYEAHFGRSRLTDSHAGCDLDHRLTSVGDDPLTLEGMPLEELIDLTLAG
jgi:hypothetical protein